MLNEGNIVGDQKTLIKSEMIRHLRKVHRTTASDWERAVFTALTGQTREDVDWDVEDNKAGYYLWVKSFDQMVEELRDEGYVAAEDEDGKAVLVATDRDEDVRYTEGVSGA